MDEEESGASRLAEQRVIGKLWAEYEGSRSREVRDRLILHYSPLVKYVASRVSVGLPANVEHADLVSYGIFGLMDAIDKFEPSRQVKFETYAIVRIKGAILDELRSIDWVPRSVRSKAKAVEKAYASLEAALLRTPTDAEVATEMGISEPELHRVFQKVSFVGLIALDEMLWVSGEREGATTLGDTIADKGDGPMQIFEVEETKEVLADAVDRLADREKTVLTLYYYEGLTMAEIGDVLGVTESRVCQIHSKAVIQLRSRLART